MTLVRRLGEGPKMLDCIGRLGLIYRVAGELSELASRKGSPKSLAVPILVVMFVLRIDVALDFGPMSVESCGKSLLPLGLLAFVSVPPSSEADRSAVWPIIERRSGVDSRPR